MKFQKGIALVSLLLVVIVVFPLALSSASTAYEEGVQSADLQCELLGSEEEAGAPALAVSDEAIVSDEATVSASTNTTETLVLARNSETPDYAGTIDLSTTITGGTGYTVNGSAPPYTNPNSPAPTVDRGLAFNAGADGKTYRIIQSGVRNNSPDPQAPKQDTSIFLSITIPDKVNVTLVLSSIDLSGMVYLSGTGTATILLDDTNYIRNSIRVPATSKITLDSLNGSDTDDRLIIPSAANAVSSHASIGGAGGGTNGNGNPSGSITINGGTISIIAHSTGAGIGGGGGGTDDTNTAGAGAPGGTTTINGGIVSVTQYGSGSDLGTGSGGAGIGGGGGNSTNGGHGGTIHITGGTVIVRQYTRGAGIGGGTYATAGTITIDGGDIDSQVIKASDTSGSGEGSAIGSAGGSNAEGVGHITINGGTVRASGYYTGIGRVHGNTGPSLSITITGGTIYAKGINGPAIGFWSASFGDKITITGATTTIIADSELHTAIGGDNSTNLHLDASADIKAYSGSSSRPAVNTDDNQGNGYYVNAGFVTAPSATTATTLKVYANSGSGGLVKTLSLPAKYRHFAYSSDLSQSRTDNILALSGATLLGTVVRNVDDSPLLYSIKTRAGYNQHNANANNAELPVKIKAGGFLPTTLTVSKTVAGSYSSADKDFTFTLRLKDSTGKALSGTFTYTGNTLTGSGVNAPANGTLTLDNEGTAQLTLRHGQSITIGGVPANGKVQLVETGATGYTTTFVDNILGAEPEDGNDTGIRDLTEDSRTFDFTNTREAVVESGLNASGTTALSLFLALVVLTGMTCFWIDTSIRRRWKGVN